MPRKKIKLWGLISYKPRWGLNIRGWLGIFLAIAFLFWLVIFKLEPFLAYSAPVKAEILVVEGWIGDEGIIGAIDEFERNPYQLIITAGAPFGRGEYLSEYRDFAHLSWATMVSLGLDPAQIQPIFTPQVIRDRTLTSAGAVKQWLDRSQLNPQAINVYTVDVHSRRTWFLYKQVFEPEVSVGIISHPPLDYDPEVWWASSEGFRKIFSEAIAYIYAKFL
ncbi:YdcF family protein [Waterburya agarophytonicola K14]|uniref:YdcF family protein n=1 Tax=Waterburya agarophytonicola KI4 TaxID=2874699 RepID=A0A964BML0_9CYAN|nr:YdcF family protein [Waterburya agarophytonicola]MCC0176269.1 YdcF family protein [Waterburya agarophytonicola KI4]